MIFFFEIIRLGLKNIRLHKMRSSLTSLGIILGVAAVIVVVAIGEGNKRMTLREIRQLGATNIILRSSKPPYASTTAESTSTFVKYGITRKDFRRLEQNLGDATLIVPLKSAGSEVGRKGDRTLSQVYGTTPQLAKAANLKVQPRGRYLVTEDLEQMLPVAVIGSAVAEQFFRLEDPLAVTFGLIRRSSGSLECWSRLDLQEELARRLLDVISTWTFTFQSQQLIACLAISSIAGRVDPPVARMSKSRKSIFKLHQPTSSSILQIELRDS